MSFRDLKKQMRRIVHDHMQVPALYIETEEAEPLPVEVRVHKEFKTVGDQKGTNFNSAEREEVFPEIIFSIVQVPEPKRHAVVSVEAGEAYSLGAAEPADGEFIKVQAMRMSAAEATGLPLPGDVA